MDSWLRNLSSGSTRGKYLYYSYMLINTQDVYMQWSISLNHKIYSNHILNSKNIRIQNSIYSKEYVK